MGNGKIDTIIIGSGISGMATGIILAGEGERVLVLEQHRKQGGLTQTFTRKGARFPTGVHRLGSLRPGQPLWYYFKYLGLMDRLELVPMDENGFEHFYFPSQAYTIPFGRDRYRETLQAYFPEQRKGIDRYFKTFETAISNISMYNPGNIPGKDRTLEYTAPLKDYLESIGISGRLQSLITGNNPLYGIPSYECPLITHFAISDSYLNSSFRINEEKTPFSKALADSLESFGGRIRVNARVTQLVLKGKTAIGVKLDTGEVLESDKTVFTGHPGRVLELCPPELFRPVFRKRLNRPNTPGLFGLALKWTESECPFTDSDAYIYDSWDVNDQYQRTGFLKDDPPGMVYLSALPNRLTSGKSDQDMAVSALTGISEQETNELKKWYRSPEHPVYREMKNKLAEKILDHIAGVYPDVRDQVEVANSYSSMTFQRYTLTENGSAYGIKKTSRHFLEGMFSPATKVRNLYLAGQSIGFNGIHGAVVSGVNVCRLLLGNDYLINKIAGVEQ